MQVPQCVQARRPAGSTLTSMPLSQVREGDRWPAADRARPPTRRTSHRDSRCATPRRGRPSTPDAGDKPEYRVEALAKGLRILSLFDEQRPTWRVTDIATAAGLPMPTVYRVVMTLTAEGYLDHLPNGDYRPGVRTLTLGTAALRSLDLVALATPKLQRLGETHRRDGQPRRAHRRPGALPGPAAQLRPRHRQHPGRARPCRPSHTSIGKLLLANLDDADLRARDHARTSFPAQHGPNAKVSLDELREELAQIREQGWAMQDEELALRAAVGGRADHRPGRPGGRRGQPRGAGPGLVDPADRARAQAGGAGHLRRDLAS